METSSSSTLINNFVIPVILNFNVAVFINIFLYSGAVASGIILANKIITLLFEEVLKRSHHKWLVKYKDKKEVAIEVIKICTEGSSAGWNLMPRDYEHVYFIARLLEGIDKNASKFFDQCISNWSLCAMTQRLNPVIKEEMDFCIKAQNRAQEACDKVLAIVQKWR